MADDLKLPPVLATPSPVNFVMENVQVIAEGFDRDDHISSIGRLRHRLYVANGSHVALCLLKALLDDEDVRGRAGELIFGAIYDGYPSAPEASGAR